MISFEDDAVIVEESTAIAIGMSAVEQKIDWKIVSIFVCLIILTVGLFKEVCF